MPGIWYKNNIDAPDLWFGKNPSSKYVLVREDRIPYPLIMSRNPTTSNWATLVHIYPNGTTIENDVGRSRIIDSRFQYGSIGVINSEKLELAYQFPASEGSTTSVGGLSNNAWMNRSHPLYKGFIQNYQLAFIQGEKNSFA
jgi:hypothetical protein